MDLKVNDFRSFRTNLYNPSKDFVCDLPGFAIDLPNILQSTQGPGRHLIQGLLDDRGDIEKTETAIEEALYGHLVGCVQDRGGRSSRLQDLPGQAERRRN